MYCFLKRMASSHTLCTLRSMSPSTLSSIYIMINFSVTIIPYLLLLLIIFSQFLDAVVTHKVRVTQAVGRSLHREVRGLRVWEIELGLPCLEGWVIPRHVQYETKEQDQKEWTKLHHQELERISFLIPLVVVLSMLLLRLSSSLWALINVPVKASAKEHVEDVVLVELMVLLIVSLLILPREIFLRSSFIIYGSLLRVA